MTMISSWKKILILMNGGAGLDALEAYGFSCSWGGCSGACAVLVMEMFRCEDEGSEDVFAMLTDVWDTLPVGELPTRARGAVRGGPVDAYESYDF